MLSTNDTWQEFLIFTALEKHIEPIKGFGFLASKKIVPPIYFDPKMGNHQKVTMLNEGVKLTLMFR